MASRFHDPLRTNAGHAAIDSPHRPSRVIPVEDGQLLDLVVLKELEHLDRPAQATAGAVIARHDQSVIREEVPPGTFSITPGWIPQGRDVAWSSASSTISAAGCAIPTRRRSCQRKRSHRGYRAA